MEEVYPPAEDSWLLEDYILKEDLHGKTCLDFGCGSGIQAVAMLKAGAKEVLSTDVNADAIKATEKKVKAFLKNAKNFSNADASPQPPKTQSLTTQKPGPSKTQEGFTGPAKPQALLGHFLGVRESEFFSKIPEKFDFIVFNPPYVPSDGIKWRDLDGGEKGRVVIDRFIVKVKQHLNDGGMVVLLISSMNNIKEVLEEFRKNGFSAKLGSNRKLFFEELVVIRAELC